MRPPLAEEFDLQPHPEGGWFRQTWRSPVTVTPAGYEGSRPAATAIYFLLMPGEQSRWHRVARSDELWLWHRGGSLILSLGGDGPAPAPATDVLLGPTQPQGVVPGGHWQAARPAADEPVLVSCVVAPGFTFADFTLHQPEPQP